MWPHILFHKPRIVVVLPLDRVLFLLDCSPPATIRGVEDEEALAVYKTLPGVEVV
jgi:hypothetical protein